MKPLNRSLSLALVALAAVSCGLAAKYEGVQQFQDGIYYQASDIKPEPEILSREDFYRMAQEQIASEQAAKRDTLYVTHDGYRSKAEDTKGNTYNVYEYPYYSFGRFAYDA